MIEFVGFLIAMGLLDSLNPFSIGLQIMLLPIIKKKYHAIWYIIGVFVTYFVGGIVLFTGLDILIKNLLLNVDFSLMPFPVIKLVLGVLLLIYVIFKLFKKNSTTQNKKTFSIHPLALFLLGVSGTVFDLPTAFPYLVILAQATAMQFTILQVLPFLFLYCIIYALPMIIIQVSYDILHEKITPTLNKIAIWVDKINRLLIIIFSILLSLFLIIVSIFSLAGNSLL